MNELQNFMEALRNLTMFDIFLVVLAFSAFFGVPAVVKTNYLRRNNLEFDERIEQRNSYILFPPVYGTKEKIWISSAYLIAVVCLILAIY